MLFRRSLTVSGFIATLLHGCTASPLEQSSQTHLNGAEDLPISRNLSAVISASPLLTFHRALCEIESVSNNELAVAELLVTYLEARHFIVVPMKVPQPPDSDLKGGRLNVFAYPDSAHFAPSHSGSASKKTPKPKIILTSHTDTVPPFIPYSLSYPSTGASVEEFDRSTILISGRGTVDDKACIATQVYAVLSLLHKQSISPSSVALLFVVGEETTGVGMRTFSSSALNTKLDYDAVLFGEPTELKLATGHKGIVMVTITAHGKAAHSGYPWLGISANSVLIRALAVLDQLGDIPEAEGGLPRSEKYGRTTVNVGLIRGGVAANVIPDSAMAKVSFRLAGGSRDAAVELITRAVKNEAVDPEGVLKLDFSQGYGPIDLDHDVPGFDEITVNYGTDVPNLERRKGMKRYLYGPGSILVAHGANEGLTVGDMEAAVEGYEKLVLHELDRSDKGTRHL